MDSEIQHHGISGMKWGKRNGPPYPLNASDKSSAERQAETQQHREKVNKAFTKSIKGGKDKEPISPAEKAAKEAGNIINDAAYITNQISSIRNKSKQSNSKAKSMSNQELRAAIERLDLERRFDSLSSTNVSSGAEYVKTILTIAGSVTGIAASTAAIISTVKGMK